MWWGEGEGEVVTKTDIESNIGCIESKSYNKVDFLRKREKGVLMFSLSFNSVKVRFSGAVHCCTFKKKSLGLQRRKRVCDITYVLI